MKVFSSWFRGFAEEFLNPINYAIAAMVGLLINVLQTGNGLASWPAFAVPVVVQALSKSILKFSQRHQQTLLRLPGEREDPAFVMAPSGTILASAGRTKELFERAGIRRIGDLFPSAGPEWAPGLTTRHCAVTGKEYRIRVQQSRGDLLVWCEDCGKKE